MLLDTDRFLDAFDILEERRDVRQPFEELLPDVAQEQAIDPIDKPLDFWEDPDEDDPWWSKDSPSALHEMQPLETLSPLDAARERSAERYEERTGEAPNVGPALADKLAQQQSLQPARWMKKYKNGRIPQNALEPIKGLHYTGGDTTHYFRADATQGLKAMVRAAKQDGVNITITDSYRSYAAQVATKKAKGSLAATAGTSVHGWGMAGDFATGREWIRDNGYRFGWRRPSWASDTYEPWHFEFRGWKGATVNADKAETSRKRSQKKPKTAKPKEAAKEAIKADIAFGGNFLSRGETDLTGGLAIPMAFTALEKDLQREINEKRKGEPKVSGKGVWAQLKKGFISAGRPDLARFVDNKDFRTWVNQESGGNPRAVSPANNQGLANGGIFQFWFGHDWAAKHYRGGKFRMSAYDQARAAVQYFGLTVSEIRRYADSIRNGSYIGWG